MFGNPFKIDKRMIIDEADIDLLGQGKPTKKENTPTPAPIIPMPPSPIPRGQKRKAGPLPKDFRFRPYKSRRTNHHHRTIEDQDTDTDSSLSSAPSSPMSPLTLTPPASPHMSPLDFADDKENSIGMNSLDTYSSSDNSGFGTDNLIIDESPQNNEDEDDDSTETIPISSFGSMFNNINDMNDVDNNNDRDDENESTPDDHQYPYEMNGSSKNDNDSFIKTSSSHKNNNIKSSSNNNNNNNNTTSTSNKITLLPNSNENGVSMTMPTPTKPAVPIPNHINHVPPITTSNHVGNSNKPKKVKVTTIVNSKTKSTPATELRNSTNELDDDTTFKKNLDLRIRLHTEIRRPVLRKWLIILQTRNK